METKFVETNALLASLREDDDEMKRILEEMLPGELWSLAMACHRVREEAHQIRMRKIRTARLTNSQK